MSVMAAKHVQSAERSDLDCLRQENLVLREELRSLHEERERTTLSQQAQSIHDFSKDERLMLNSFANSLVEQKAQLRESINGFHGRPRSANAKSFGGRELENLGKRLESMHQDLMGCSLMSNLKGKHTINQGRSDFHSASLIER